MLAAIILSLSWVGDEPANLHTAFLDIRRQTQAKVVKLCRDFETAVRDKDTHRATLIAYQLGDLNSTYAIPVLIRHIAFQPPASDAEAGPIRTLERFLPCAGVLAKIGPPCYPALVKLITSEHRAEYHKYAAFVFVQSIGAEMATFYLERAKGRETSRDAKERIDSTISFVRKYKGLGSDQ